jgi:hypothetical protein
MNRTYEVCRSKEEDEDAILMQEGPEIVGWVISQQSILPDLNNWLVLFYGTFQSTRANCHLNF